MTHITRHRETCEAGHADFLTCDALSMWPQNHAISFSVVFAKMLHKFCSGEKFGVFVKMKPMTMFLIMLAGWINRHQQVAM